MINHYDQTMSKIIEFYRQKQRGVGLFMVIEIPHTFMMPFLKGVGKIELVPS